LAKEDPFAAKIAKNNEFIKRSWIVVIVEKNE
jgi:hypothetical protein